MSHEVNHQPIDQSKRKFLRVMAGLGTAAVIGGVPAVVNGMEQVASNEKKIQIPSYQHTLNLPKKPYEHEQRSIDLTFKSMWNTHALPFRSSDGLQFDLNRTKYILPEDTTSQHLLLVNRPAFNRWRDSEVTPELARHSNKINKIVLEADQNIAAWQRTLSRIQSVDTTEPQELSQLLELRQFSKALADVLVYTEYNADEFNKLSLEQRLESGKTNCFEFSLLTSIALAREPLSLPTEILYFQFKDQNNETKAHVCNVANINNSPVVIDIAGFGSHMMSLSEYVGHYADENITIFDQLEYTSIFATESYEPFPWYDLQWINGSTSLSMRAAYDPSL